MTVSRTEGQHLALLHKTFIKKLKHLGDDAWDARSVNLIFLVNYYYDTKLLKNFVAKVCTLCVINFLESVM
jgi:hypothetical protein